MRVETNVAYTQTKGCKFCLHVGSTALFFGKSDGIGARLEILTPTKWWRFSRWSRNHNDR